MMAGFHSCPPEAGKTSLKDCQKLVEKEDDLEQKVRNG